MQVHAVAFATPDSPYVYFHTGMTYRLCTLLHMQSLYMQIHCLVSGEPRAARPAQQPPPPSAPASVAAPALATLVSPSSVSGDGCLIKGNIGAKGDRIYHVPGGRFYPGVKVIRRTLMSRKHPTMVFV